MKNRENRLYISESSERELRPVKVSAPFRRFGVVMSLGDWFEFTYYLRDSNYNIKPLEVMSVLLGTRQPHFLVLSHCAEPALGDIPRIPAEYERSTQPRKAGKSVHLKWGKGCCFFSGFNP